MHIRGFAMVDGVSFTDGRRRVTGKMRSDGTWEIREGGKWYWRFSPRQIAAAAGIGLVWGASYVWPTLNEGWLDLLLLLLVLPMIRLSRSHRRFHGAEHTAVNLWEGKTPSVLHPGCGSNLVLMLLPGLLIDLLPFSWWVVLLGEVIYIALVIRVVWPFWMRGLRRGRRWALGFWRVCQVWQRLFVAEPGEEDVRLACRVLERLIDGGNSISMKA